MVQCTSVSEASWKTIALVPPASPDSVGREHEGDQLVLVRLVAERDGPRLVLPDGLQHLPERRVDGPVDQEEPAEEDRQHHEVERHRLAQIEEAEERAPRHGLDPILAMGERRLEAEEVDHLGERQRDHREIDALAPDREPAHDQSQRPRRGRPAQDGQLRRPSPHLGGMGRHVPRRAEERRVPERQEPRVADQEVEGAREQRKAQRLHEEERIDDERRQHEEGDHQREGHVLMPQRARCRGQRARLGVVRRHATGRARRGPPA